MKWEALFCSHWLHHPSKCCTCQPRGVYGCLLLTHTFEQCTMNFGHSKVVDRNAGDLKRAGMTASHHGGGGEEKKKKNINQIGAWRKLLVAPCHLVA